MNSGASPNVDEERAAQRMPFIRFITDFDFSAKVGNKSPFDAAAARKQQAGNGLEKRGHRSVEKSVQMNLTGQEKIGKRFRHVI